MAERITNKWTKDLKGAFGDTQQIRNAIKGEQMWERYARGKYASVINHSADKSKQTAGVDFTINGRSLPKPITVDVKANMKWGYFYVENNKDGWLRNPNKKTDWIAHIEVRNGWVCEYNREDMIAYFDKKEYKQDLVKISSYKEGIQSFVRKYDCTKKRYKSKSKSRPKFSEQYVHANSQKYLSYYYRYNNPPNNESLGRRCEKAWDTDKYPMEEYDDVTDTFYYPYGEVKGFSDSD